MNYNKCRFSQHKTKYNTARVVVWNEFKVINSFTLECSMFGKTLEQPNGRNLITQLTDEDFQNIAVNLVKSIRQLSQMDGELVKELTSTKGWLKKKKLDELI